MKKITHNPGSIVFSLFLAALMLAPGFTNKLTALPPEDLPKPSTLQVDWQKLETIAFIHFSVNTFTDSEWGYGNESPELFDPTQLDCRQWVKICKDAGLKGVILTAKHHDGFCLWPSKYTGHSVKNSPWKHGEGDVVREFSDACKELGLKIGLYLSPWDCNHAEYGKPGYNEYFKSQLRELLTNYGEIFEIWFDGANGGRGYYGTDSLHVRKIPGDYYDWDGIGKIVKELQPNCIIHGGALAEIRWVGNEEGYAGETHWSMFRPWDQLDKNISSRIQMNTGHEDGSFWLPSETDVSVRPGWYYHASEDHQVKSLPQLMDIYYESVGRNSLLLLNLSPDKRGLIHPLDSARVLAWREELDRDFEKNLVNDSCRFSSGNGTHARDAFDSNFDSYWQASGNFGQLEVDFGKEQEINRLLLQEFIPEGQKVRSFAADYWNGSGWKEFQKGTTIGYKRILRFQAVKATKMRIRIEDALAPPMISTVEVYHAPILPVPPGITREQHGLVRIISPDKDADVYYTTDGSVPSQTAKKYAGPFMMDGKVTIKAVMISSSGAQGEMAEKQFVFSKADWRVGGETVEITKLLDGNQATSWFGGGDQKEVVIDFGKPLSFSGISMLPDQSRHPKGIPLNYAVLISNDGKTWEKVVSGEFQNIMNNPNWRKIMFFQPVNSRFLKFEATSLVNGQKQLGLAELELTD
ncbi:MAG: alpha-L-fucosidase [Prolixibacteraceae bacterium]